MAVRARGWCRVDLAGGTLDIWPLGLLHRGARTINVAIDLPVSVEAELRTTGYRVEQGGESQQASTLDELAALPATDLIGEILRELDSPPIALKVASGSPRGGGLGASSALAVTLIAAIEQLTGRPRSTPEAASALARDLEARLMALPTGRQDHFPALLGGALEIFHDAGGDVVRQLDADLESLGDCLVVAYTGRSHFSAGKNWQVVRRRLDGEARSIELFAGISETAAELCAALEAGDLPAVGELMAREWAYRRQLAAGVSTPEIEQLLDAGRAAGAWGGKATGAGGGGCVALLAPAASREKVAAALLSCGAQLLAARPASDPLSVTAC